MQIVINIGKAHFYAIVLVICLIGGGFVVAYNDPGDQNGAPVQMGHSLGELGGGLTDLGQIDCNPYDSNDCDPANPADGAIRGMVIRAQPENGVSILELIDMSPSAPGGNALKVEGNALFNGGDVALLQVAQDQGAVPSGNYPLCLVRSFGNDNGKIVVC
jgi:hypothetical protein